MVINFLIFGMHQFSFLAMKYNLEDAKDHVANNQNVTQSISYAHHENNVILWTIRQII